MKTGKILIVYSSRKTGNSKKVAEAVHASLAPDSELHDVSNAPDPSGYEFVILGFGIYRGWPDEAMRGYMRRCKNIEAGIFITLGAWPDSEHSHICIGRAEGILELCSVRATFACHGRLDPDMVKRMKERPAGSPHRWDEERARRVEAAESHPDENDLKKASEIFRTAWEKISSNTSKR